MFSSVGSRFDNNLCPHCLYFGSSEEQLQSHILSSHYQLDDQNKVDIKPNEIACSYCDVVCLRIEYKKHVLMQHLDAAGSVVPNAVSVNPVPLKNSWELPDCDDWIIDYSEVGINDPVFKHELGNKYRTIFHSDAEEPSCSLSQDCSGYFKYNVSSCSSLKGVTKYHWKCPECRGNGFLKYYHSLKHLILGACVHACTRHHNNKVLLNLAEYELKYFNVVHGTNFSISNSGLESPLIFSDYILTGREADFMVEELHPVSKSPHEKDYFLTCRFCFEFVEPSLFLAHITSSHNYLPHDNPIFVKPSQLEASWSRKSSLEHNPFAFSMDGFGCFYWKCRYCEKLIKDKSLPGFIATLAAHVMFETHFKRDQELGMSLKKLLRLGNKYSNATFKVREWMLENCRNAKKEMQKLFIDELPAAIERICLFCNKKFYLPEMLDDDVALLLHLDQDHRNKDKDYQVLQYLLSVNKSNVFPYLRMILIDQEDRKCTCSLCGFRCNDLITLWNHALWHDDQILPELKFEDLFLELTPMLYQQCENLIDALPQSLFTKMDPDLIIYVCIKCDTKFTSDDPHMAAVIKTHLYFCDYPDCMDGIYVTKRIPIRPTVLKTNRCKRCRKGYHKKTHAEFCCYLKNQKSATIVSSFRRKPKNSF